MVGTFLGLLIAFNTENIQLWLEGMMGHKLFADELYFLSHLPSKVDTGEVVMVMGMALALSFPATIYFRQGAQPRSTRRRRCAMSESVLVLEQVTRIYEQATASPCCMSSAWRSMAVKWWQRWPKRLRQNNIALASQGCLTRRIPAKYVSQAAS